MGKSYQDWVLPELSEAIHHLEEAEARMIQCRKWADVFGDHRAANFTAMQARTAIVRRVLLNLFVQIRDQRKED